MVALSANTNRHTLLTLLTNACLLSQQMSATMCTVSLLQATAGCAGRVWHLISGMRGAFRIRCYGHFGFGLQQSHTSHSHTRKAHERPSSDSLTPTHSSDSLSSVAVLRGSPILGSGLGLRFASSIWRRLGKLVALREAQRVPESHGSSKTGGFPTSSHVLLSAWTRVSTPPCNRH